MDIETERKKLKSSYDKALAKAISEFDSDIKNDYDKLLKEHTELKAEFDKVISLIEPTWAEVMRGASTKERQDAFDMAMDGLQKFKGGIDSEEGQHLVAWLEKEFDFVGFAANSSYVRKSGKNLESLFIHPYGQRTLLFVHKTLPMAVYVNSSLKFNKTALSSIKGNECHVKNGSFDVIGITG
jgi:hypothetical protein